VKKFKFLVADPDHYINRAIRFFAEGTDAPRDIHEAYAMLHLSLACRELRWKFSKLSSIRERMNMYFIYYGEAGEARKSTAMRIHREFLDDVFPYSPFFQGDAFTPQGLRDGLVEIDGYPTVVHFDEMEDVIMAITSKGSNMGQLPMMLKRLYSEGRHVTRLSSVGKKKGDDKIIIDDSYVCLMGNVTPTITSSFPQRYLTDGLISRMHIIMRTEEYKPRGVKEGHTLKILVGDDGHRITREGQRIGLAGDLRDIENACSRLVDDEVVVEYSEGALDVLGAFDDEVEDLKNSYEIGYEGKSSFERLKMSAIKTSSLVAAGRLGGKGIAENRGVRISEQDAIDGSAFARKLLSNAKEFIMLCIGTDESKRSNYMIDQVKRLMLRMKKNHVSEIDLRRACRNKMKAQDVQECLRALTGANELVMAKIDGVMVYSIPVPINLTSEPIEPEVDEDPRIPGEVTPF